MKRNLFGFNSPQLLTFLYKMFYLDIFIVKKFSFQCQIYLYLIHTHTYICMCVCCMLSHPLVSDYLQSRGLQPVRLLCPWNFPGKITGVGCHSLFHGIFPTQELNQSPALQVDSLPTDLSRKPICIRKNINFLLGHTYNSLNRFFLLRKLY